MNQAYAHIHESYIQNGAIEAGLRVDQILRDFAFPKEADTNLFTILCGAFGVASASIGPLGPLAANPAGVLGVVSSAMVIVAQHNPNKPPVPLPIRETLLEFFVSTEKNMMDIMHRALGYGDMRLLPGEMLTEMEPYETPVARFFDEGKFLVANIGVYMKDLIEGARKRMVSIRSVI